MKKISAINQEGESETFNVSIGDTNMIDVYEATEYLIHKQDTIPNISQCFIFRVVKISEDRRMIFMIDNQDRPELSGKGIVKAMIQKLSEEFNCDIVSSTNKDLLKIDQAEGRIPNVTAFWNRWQRNLGNVEYFPSEDRFIYRRG